MYRCFVSVSALLMVGLYGNDSGCEGEPETTPWGVPGVDYSEPGPLGVSTSSDTLAAPSGCDLSYKEYLPAGQTVGPLIVLSHGFQRNSGHMADLGEHLASWGFHVVTPDLCHSTPTNNDPQGDASDIIALAASLGADKVGYLGHSAGGMRSVLAANVDPNATIYYGLDMVDLKNIALDTAPTYPIFAGGLLGEPSACNTDNNGLPFYESAPQAIAFRVTEADHCDFESPTDGLCTSFCAGTNDRFDETTIHNAIFGLTTSYLLWRTGSDPNAAEWWLSRGETYLHLVEIGLIEQLVP